MSESQIIEEKKDTLNRKATVAGLFYVLVQILVRGITFLFTPVYTRLVSTAQYGEIRVYESWLLILVPVFSLSLNRSVSRAKFDFGDSYNEYISSIQTLSFLSIFAFFAVSLVTFREKFFSFFQLDTIMFIFMILYVFAYSTILIYQGRERQLMRYKKSVSVTAAMMIPATILSIALLYLGNLLGRQDKLVDLRVIGYYTPQVLGGLILAVLIWKKGGIGFNKEHWKYAVAFSVPLIPEVMSIQIMNQSDKIMVQKMVSNDAAGIFALATTVSFIIWIIEDAVWNAWLPWLFEKISRDEKQDIQKPWDLVMIVFGLFSWILVIFGPEIIYVLGGSKYKEAVYLITPMVTGTLFRFFSNSMTSIEHYQKKTGYCALGALIAAAINLVLNAIFIKKIGYQAAAYTTAFSYFVLLFIQGFIEKRVCGENCVSFRKVVLFSLLFYAVNQVTVFSYDMSFWWRLLIAAGVSGVVLVLNLKQVKLLVDLVLKRQ